MKLARMTMQGEVLDQSAADWWLIAKFWSFPDEGEVRFEAWIGPAGTSDLWQWNPTSGLNKIAPLSKGSDVEGESVCSLSPQSCQNSREFSAFRVDVIYGHQEERRNTFDMRFELHREHEQHEQHEQVETWHHHLKFSKNLEIDTHSVGNVCGVLQLGKEPKHTMVRIFDDQGQIWCESPLPANQVAGHDELWADPQRAKWVTSRIEERNGRLYEQPVVWTL